MCPWPSWCSTDVSDKKPRAVQWPQVSTHRVKRSNGRPRAPAVLLLLRRCWFPDTLFRGPVGTHGGEWRGGRLIQKWASCSETPCASAQKQVWYRVPAGKPARKRGPENGPNFGEPGWAPPGGAQTACPKLGPFLGTQMPDRVRSAPLVWIPPDLRSSRCSSRGPPAGSPADPRREPIRPSSRWCSRCSSRWASRSATALWLGASAAPTHPQHDETCSGCSVWGAARRT